MTPLPPGILANLQTVTLQAVAFDSECVVLWDTVDERGWNTPLTKVRDFTLTQPVETDPAFMALVDAWEKAKSHTSPDHSEA
jgi:hypothetical protein